MTRGILWRRCWGEVAREGLRGERTHTVKKIRDQMLVMNFAILAGFGFEYWLGIPLFFITTVSVMMLLLANFIFLVRMVLYLRANKKR